MVYFSGHVTCREGMIMDEVPTVLVLGRRKTDNMPSLTRMLEILKPRDGMDATVRTSAHITSLPEMTRE